ncbi:uncharacterized protein ISCGN_022458 [Ixodes scapularis]
MPRPRMDFATNKWRGTTRARMNSPGGYGHCSIGSFLGASRRYASRLFGWTATKLTWMSAPVVIRTWFLCCHIIFGGGAVVTSQRLRSPSSHSRWCCHGLWLVGVPSLLTKPVLPVVPVEMVAGTWRGFAATAGSSVTFLWLFGFSQLLKGVAGLSWATQCFARTFTECSNVGKQVEDSLFRFLSRGRYALPGPVSVNITAEKTSDTLQTCQEARKGSFFTHRLHLGD